LLKNDIPLSIKSINQKDFKKFIWFRIVFIVDYCNKPMVDIAKQFSESFVKGSQIDENLAEELRDLLIKEDEVKHISKHYGLTELCNPQKSYWNRKSPGSEIPKKLRLLWRRGTKLHNFASRWFQEHPDCLVSEATLDGFDVGIPGIIGRMDFKCGESIVEFKTKEKIPKNSEEIISLFPQDLEQLLFYSVMHIKHPLINYLVFMDDKKPHNLKAFKVEIKDLDKIKKLLEQRKAMLDLALETGDPSPLGRCRYFRGLCEIKTSKKCDCENLKDLPVDILQNSVTITFDEDLENDLIKYREKTNLSSELFTTYEIIAPRKSFAKRILAEEQDYSPNEVLEDRKDLLGTLIKRLKKSPSARERELIEKSLKEKKLYIGKRWINIKSTKHLKGITIPYLVKADRSNDKRALSFPGQYALAELAIICAAYGKENGIIFKIYPNLENAIQVFKVNFKDLEKCLKEIRSILNNLERINQSKDIFDLPPCPFYMNIKRDCFLTEECHKNEGGGCLIGYKSKEKS